MREAVAALRRDLTRALSSRETAVVESSGSGSNARVGLRKRAGDRYGPWRVALPATEGVGRRVRRRSARRRQRLTATPQIFIPSATCAPGPSCFRSSRSACFCWPAPFPPARRPRAGCASIVVDERVDLRATLDVDVVVEVAAAALVTVLVTAAALAGPASSATAVEPHTSGVIRLV